MLMKLFGIISISLLTLCLSLISHAQIKPIRDVQDALPSADVLERLKKEGYWDTTLETNVQRVKTAKVLTADYELLKKDFKILRKLSHAAIDEWILENTALISSSQLKTNEVNSPIEVEETIKSAFRLPLYNRALVYKVPGGLIDAKGVGTARPMQRHHGNGLASTGESIREFIYQKNGSKYF